jgi:hypothetical protein
MKRIYNKKNSMKKVVRLNWKLKNPSELWERGKKREREREKKTLWKKTTNSFVRVHVTIFKSSIDLVIRYISNYFFQALYHFPTRRRNSRQRWTFLSPDFTAHLLPHSDPLLLGFRRDHNSYLFFSLSFSLLILFLSLSRFAAKRKKKEKWNPLFAFSISHTHTVLSFFKKKYFYDNFYENDNN